MLEKKTLSVNPFIVILACYADIGCDYISKIGTKLRALSAFPEKFLQKFGHKDLDDSDIVKAEQYNQEE